MEWLLAGIFALLMLIWSVVFLAAKLIKLRPLVAPIQEQLDLLAKATERAPELVRPASALEDDPAIHVASRLELQRRARKLKRERSRRLSSRRFR
jgi:hypothetical protein